MSYWSKWFLRGWAILLGGVLGWELFGYWKRINGDKSYPPLSNICALVPRPIRYVVLTVLWLVLLWHFDEVERFQLRKVPVSQT